MRVFRISEPLKAERCRSDHGGILKLAFPASFFIKFPDELSQNADDAVRRGRKGSRLGVYFDNSARERIFGNILSLLCIHNTAGGMDGF